MSKRDHEVVEDYKKLFATMFSSPHLTPVDGRWYLVQYPEEPPWVVDLAAPRIEGWAAEPEGGLTVESLIERGYTATPLLIYKVDTDKVR